MMKEERFYDPLGKRLVYCWRNASPCFWDEHWQFDDFRKAVIKSRSQFVVWITKRYLHGGARVIEGGCGMGDKVYALYRAGFDAYGADFASTTIKLIRQHVPELKVVESDVRDLPFTDGFFDGYWSLGVIEHFYDGYDDIAMEMSRIIRRGGHLFLVFPYMSPLRRFKSFLGYYPDLPVNFYPEEREFYQFALNAKSVIHRMDSMGFSLIHKIGIGGVKGLKDEIPILKPFLQKIFDSRTHPARIAKIIMDISFFIFSAHSILLVMRKR